jgi:transcriptional regulator with XRE-family HTH domain
MTREALDLLCSTLRSVAAELGVSANTVRSYHSGRRSPSSHTAQELASLLRHRGRALIALAERIDHLAAED